MRWKPSARRPRLQQAVRHVDVAVLDDHVRKRAQRRAAAVDVAQADVFQNLAAGRRGRLRGAREHDRRGVAPDAAVRVVRGPDGVVFHRQAGQPDGGCFAVDQLERAGVAQGLLAADQVCGADRGSGVRSGRAVPDQPHEVAPLPEQHGPGGKAQAGKPVAARRQLRHAAAGGPELVQRLLQGSGVVGLAVSPRAALLHVDAPLPGYLRRPGGPEAERVRLPFHERERLRGGQGADAVLGAARAVGHQDAEARPRLAARRHLEVDGPIRRRRDASRELRLAVQTDQDHAHSGRRGGGRGAVPFAARRQEVAAEHADRLARVRRALGQPPRLGPVDDRCGPPRRGLHPQRVHVGRQIFGQHALDQVRPHVDKLKTPRGLGAPPRRAHRVDDNLGAGLFRVARPEAMAVDADRLARLGPPRRVENRRGVLRRDPCRKRRDHRQQGERRRGAAVPEYLHKCLPFPFGHCFSPPPCAFSMNERCAKKNKTAVGIMATRETAISRFHCVPNEAFVLACLK